MNIEIEYLVEWTKPTDIFAKIHQPYVYKFINKKDGRWYIGCRTKIGCHPEDDYTTSCANSKFTDLILQDELTNNPQEWIKQVLFIGTAEEVAIRERDLLMELDARNDNMSFNKAHAGLILTEAECEHCSIVTRKGNYVKWHGDKCLSNPNLSEDELQKLRDERYPYTCEHCRIQTTKVNYVKWHGNKCIKNPENIAAGITKNQVERCLCEHCGGNYIRSQYVRWHGDKCIKNPENESRIEEIKILRREAPYIKCEHCNEEYTPETYANYHGDNCYKRVNVSSEERLRIEQLWKPCVCEHCGNRYEPLKYKYNHGDKCKYNPANFVECEHCHELMPTTEYNLRHGKHCIHQQNFAISKIYGRKRIICEHCNKDCSPSVYYKQHKDKCKGHTKE